MFGELLGREVGFVYKYKKSKNLSLGITHCFSVDIGVGWVEALSRSSSTTAGRVFRSLGWFPWCVHRNFPNLFLPAPPLSCTQFSEMAVSVVLRLQAAVFKLIPPYQRGLLALWFSTHYSLAVELGESSRDAGLISVYLVFWHTLQGWGNCTFNPKSRALGSWQKHMWMLLTIKPTELAVPSCIKVARLPSLQLTELKTEASTCRWSWLESLQAILVLQPNSRDVRELSEPLSTLSCVCACVCVCVSVCVCLCVCVCVCVYIMGECTFSRLQLQALMSYLNYRYKELNSCPLEE